MPELTDIPNEFIRDELDEFVERVQQGLTLADFYRNTSAFQKLLPPSPESTKDFKATLRGVKKNLIYLDLFILNRKYDAIYQKISTKKGDRKP